MTARDTIAAAVHADWCARPGQNACQGPDHRDATTTDRVIAAILAMAPDELAELIGAESVEQADGRTALYVGESWL